MTYSDKKITKTNDGVTIKLNRQLTIKEAATLLNAGYTIDNDGVQSGGQYTFKKDKK